MAEAWKKYKQAIANKRQGNKKKSTSSDILKKEEIIVQRLSAEVTGKAQKYSRVGPREFIPYEHDEISISNIKDACIKHFASIQLLKTWNVIFWRANNVLLVPLLTIYQTYESFTYAL